MTSILAGVVGVLAVKVSVPCVNEPPLKLPEVKEPEPPLEEQKVDDKEETSIEDAVMD